jgi:ParB-like chromosome segregation protein Spo0J
MTVIEEANAYQTIVEMGKTVDEVAALLGKSADMVRTRLALLNLRDDVQELVARGQIGRNTANMLSRLDFNGQGEVLRKLQDGSFANEIEASRYCSAVYARQAQAGLFGEPQDELTAARAEARRASRTKFQHQMDKLAALTSAFQTVLEMDPGTLAEALDADVHGASTVANEVNRLAAKTANMLRHAAAIYDAGQAEQAAEAG